MTTFILFTISCFLFLSSCDRSSIHSQLEEPYNVQLDKVVSVADGDTITVLQDSKRVKVRLANIDAPESRQDYGTVSKTFLAKLVHGKHVRIRGTKKDRYGRLIAEVFIDGENVNRKMVANGLAWEYVKYSNDSALSELQSEAKRQKLGLWAGNKPIEPWKYRRMKKK